jgi:hypothetical protein
LASFPLHKLNIHLLVSKKWGKIHTGVVSVVGVGEEEREREEWIFSSQPFRF